MLEKSRNALRLLLVAAAATACQDAVEVDRAVQPVAAVDGARLDTSPAPAGSVSPIVIDRLNALSAAYEAAASSLDEDDAEDLEELLEEITELLLGEDDDDDDGDGDDGINLKKAAKQVEKFVKVVEKSVKRGRMAAATADSLLGAAARLTAALTGEVTAEHGGTVVAEGGAVVLDVPAGATTGTVKITVERIAAPVSDTKVLSGTAYEFGPDGTVFEKPVTVTLAFSAAAVPDGLPVTSLYIAKNVSGSWQRVPGPVSVDAQAGTVTGELTSFSQYAVKADPCAARPQSLAETGEITVDDCVYVGANGPQYEDFYHFSPADLLAESGQTIPGPARYTVTASAAFRGIVGVKQAGFGVQDGLVFGSRTFEAGQPKGLSVIGDGSALDLFVGGADATQLGAYSLTTAVAPAGGWQCGDLVFLSSAVAFGSQISNGTSCRGTITVGPNAGQPLNYQYRYAKLEAGKRYEVRVDDAAPGIGVALYVASGVNQLDLGSDQRDSDRSITFTAAETRYYYLEVSTPPDVATTYTFSLAEATGDACTPKDLDPLTNGSVDAGDCVFTASNGVQSYEDFYRVSVADLLRETGDRNAGSKMLTFTATAGFEGIVGVKQAGFGPQEGTVYGFTRFLPNQAKSFTVVGDLSDYELFVGGKNLGEQGAYSINTTTESANGFICGRDQFIAGPARFDSSIYGGSGACSGTIQFGPYAGQPLRYQPRWAKLEAGMSYTVTLSNVTPGVGFALFVGSGVNQLDLGDSSGDTDRSITFTAPETKYYYVEVSTPPGVTSGYTLELREN